MQWTWLSTNATREPTSDWYPCIELLSGQVLRTPGLSSITNRLVVIAPTGSSEMPPYLLGLASVVKPSASTTPLSPASRPPYVFTLDLPANLLTLPEQQLATGVPILLKVDADGHTSRRSVQPLWTSFHDNHTHQTGVSFTGVSPSATWGTFPRLTPTGSMPSSFSGHACNGTPSLALLHTCVLFAALCFYCRM